MARGGVCDVARDGGVAEFEDRIDRLDGYHEDAVVALSDVDFRHPMKEALRDQDASVGDTYLHGVILAEPFLGAPNEMEFSGERSESAATTG